MYNLDISALGAVVSKSIWPPESENIRMVKNCVTEIYINLGTDNTGYIKAFPLSSEDRKFADDMDF